MRIPGTLVDIVEEMSNSLGCIEFFENLGKEPRSLDYVLVNKYVNDFASNFQRQGLKKGDLIIFPFESSLESLVSFLGLIQLGVIPLSVRLSLSSGERKIYLDFINNISQKFDVKNILDTESNKGIDFNINLIKTPQFSSLDNFKTQEFVKPDPEDIAFVQFSSGSTSFPKGVPISHKNIVSNLFTISSRVILGESMLLSEQNYRQLIEKNETCLIGNWLPLYHDMGLVGSVLAPMLTQQSFFFTSPIQFLRRPTEWLKLLSSKKATVTGLPNFAVDYILKQIKSAGVAANEGVDLSNMKIIFNGSEPINFDNLLEFVDALSPLGLKQGVMQPSYGMAEATLMITCADGDLKFNQVIPTGKKIVSVGKAAKGVLIQIRKENGSLAQDLEIGEVEIKGGSLANRYFGSEKSFLTDQGFFRTGDIGFLKDNELYIVGRNSERIKINGQSYFFVDIDQAVEMEFPELLGKIATIEFKEKIFVLIEAKAKEFKQESVINLKSKIQECILKGANISIDINCILFILPGQILRTSSGKLKRNEISNKLSEKEIQFLKDSLEVEGALI